MNLDAFSPNTLQTFKILLGLAAEKKITTVLELSSLIERKVEEERQAFLVEHPVLEEFVPSDSPPRVIRAPCPECGHPTQRMLIEGSIILSCKKCRWSTLITGDSHGLC